MRQYSIPTLVQTMACRPFGATPLSESTLPYCQLDPKEHISVNFCSKLKTLYSRKYPSKMSSAKWRPFCLGFHVLHHRMVDRRDRECDRVVSMALLKYTKCSNEGTNRINIPAFNVSHASHSFQLLRNNLSLPSGQNGLPSYSPGGDQTSGILETLYNIVKPSIYWTAINITLWAILLTGTISEYWSHHM